MSIECIDLGQDITIFIAKNGTNGYGHKAAVVQDIAWWTNKTKQNKIKQSKYF